MQPLWRLLRARPDDSWGAREKGALRSVVANRQWPQSRLCQAGIATTSNCRLCVHFGFCTPQDDDPKFKGTLLHRTWTCPASRLQRERFVPQWLREEVQAKIQGNSMESAELLLFTRALAKSPESLVGHLPLDETFIWHTRPAANVETGALYTDGSLLFTGAEWRGVCTARLGICSCQR